VIALALLVLLLLAGFVAAWKGVGRNQSTVDQQAVDPRRPFDR
jgi:hypothetical protein